MKLGILVASTFEEAGKLDKTNSNNFWATAIVKECSRAIVTFELLESDGPIPIGSKKTPYYFVFDVKFDLTRKSRLVAGSHRNKDIPAHSTYAPVVTRRSVRITILLAALNGSDILAGDIGYTYLNVPCEEKVFHNR